MSESTGFVLHSRLSVQDGKGRQSHEPASIQTRFREGFMPFLQQISGGLAAHARRFARCMRRRKVADRNGVQSSVRYRPTPGNASRCPHDLRLFGRQRGPLRTNPRVPGLLRSSQKLLDPRQKPQPQIGHSSSEPPAFQGSGSLRSGLPFRLPSPVSGTDYFNQLVIRLSTIDQDAPAEWVASLPLERR